MVLFTICFVFNISVYNFDDKKTLADTSKLKLSDNSMHTLKAGFSKVQITPPIGTYMTGFGSRDFKQGCKGINDDLFVRALYLEQGDKKILIMGFDLLFFSREEADRYNGAIGRVLSLSPSQILLNTSHTHNGPKVGSWYYTPSDPFYLNELGLWILNAAQEAQYNAREVTLWAGETKTTLPMSRRYKDVNGKILFQPNPEGIVYDRVPVALFKDLTGKPVCLLFSVSCHASTISGDTISFQISADYPGVAMGTIDKYLGISSVLFLQGAGGDSKPSVIGKGEKKWRSGNWEDMKIAGDLVAKEVIRVIETGLKQIEPEIQNFTTIVDLPFVPIPSMKEYEKVFEDAQSEKAKRLWAEEKMTILKRGYNLPTFVPITVQGIQLGKGLRLIGVEAEIVAEIGFLIKNFYNAGITFPLGYCNGTQLYLPTSNMLDEGGYEAESYWEYRHPAPLAKGIEIKLTQALQKLLKYGIK
jgi:hypothetical protein